MFAALRVSKESQSSEARSVVNTKIHLVQIRKYIFFKYKHFNIQVPQPGQNKDHLESYL